MTADLTPAEWRALLVALGEAVNRDYNHHIGNRRVNGMDIEPIWRRLKAAVRSLPDGSPDDPSEP